MVTQPGRRPSSSPRAAHRVQVTASARRKAQVPWSPRATAPTLAAAPMPVAAKRTRLFLRVATGSGWRTRTAEMMAQRAERWTHRARSPATTAVNTSRASYARGDQASTASRRASASVRRCCGCGVSVMRRGVGQGVGWTNSRMQPLVPGAGNGQYVASAWPVSTSPPNCDAEGDLGSLSGLEESGVDQDDSTRPGGVPAGGAQGALGAHAEVGLTLERRGAVVRHLVGPLHEGVGSGGARVPQVHLEEMISPLMVWRPSFRQVSSWSETTTSCRPPWAK